MSKYWKHSDVLMKSMSPTHKAVVATKQLPAKEVVFHYGAPLVKTPTKYTLQLDENNHIDSNVEHEWRYMNHSCEPNARIANVQVNADSGSGSFDMETLRDISEGEELTFNYLTTEYDMSTPFKCICNAETCVGDIKGYKYLSQEQKDRIEKYGVMDYVKNMDKQDSEQV